MFRLFRIALLCCLPWLLQACVATPSHAPSPEAQGMAGAEGTFDFKPADWQAGQTTWWKDTDGVDPGTPGCHIGTDSQGVPNGRIFAEACLPDGKLVESNPGVDVVHSHSDDTGHPDKFDCNAWCIGKGASGGSCIAAPAPLCAQSAKCACE
jgi:hypothetical protein